MAFDVLVVNPGRLRILTALAAEPTQEFVRLRSVTRLTDGNLSTHARRLAHGGLVAIRKSIQNGKPVTHIHLTPTGREALEAHVHNVTTALSGNTHHPEPAHVAASDSDDWVD